MVKSSEDMLLCTKCVTDSRFRKWIRKTGQREQCNFVPNHGGRNSTVRLELFCGYVDGFFRKNYQKGKETDGWYSEQNGNPLSEILSEELGADDEYLIKIIIKNLPDASDRDISKGDETFYDDTVNYESLAEVAARNQASHDDYWYENRFSVQWQKFCKKVQYQDRFFNTKETLDNLFGKLSEYEGGNANPVYTLQAGQKIFRARALDESFTEKLLNKNPAKELGAPPKDRTRAGRMNVEYVPAFYGAFSERIAISELRPGIGEKVAIGEFILEHDIRVFDFAFFSSETLNNAIEKYSHTRFEFIMQMESEISLRILPYEKQRQYIPTQIVAQYLKVYFECEAIIYRSSVTNEKTEESRNIVFLPRAKSFTERSGLILRHKKFEIREVEEVVYTISKKLEF